MPWEDFHWETDRMCRQSRPGFSINDQDAFLRTLDDILDLPEVW